MKSRFYKRVFVTLFLVFGCLSIANSAVVKKQVLASIRYEPKGFIRKKVAPESRDKVECVARDMALSMYLSDCPPARRALLDQVSSELSANITKVVPQLIVLNEVVDKERKKLEISATASIDIGYIDSLLAKHNGGSGTISAASKEPVDVVFIFIARKIKTLVTSDGKRVDFSKETTSSIETEGVRADADGVSVDYNLEDLKVKEYGGKKIDKAQEIEWEAMSVSSVDTAVNEVLTQAGYESISPVWIEGFNLQSFRDDYSAGDDLTQNTMLNAVRVLKGPDPVELFANGRMDITLPSAHPVTGLPQVFVKVEAVVYNIAGRRPKNVASVSGEYYQGVGANVQVATQNALLSAARKTSIKLTDQLRAKGY